TARLATTPSTATRLTVRTAASVPTGIPKSFVTAARLLSRHDTGDVRDGNVVHLTARRRLEDRHELFDLLAVEPRRHPGRRGLLIAPERRDKRLALRRREDVAALIAVLDALGGHHGVLIELDELSEASADNVDLGKRDSRNHLRPPPG